MEGSRHERAVLVLTAYIIGFTTAFIAYALPAKHYTKTVITQVASVDRSIATDTSVPHTTIYLDETGLYVSTPQSTQLLTVNQSSPFMAGAVVSAPTSGVHYRLIDAELSRDRDFVYFCEQLTETTDVCDPYVFSLGDNTLHAITIDGELYTADVQTHMSSWSADGKLQLDGYSSKTSQEPWKLISQ